MANKNLSAAKRNKNDEFYTQLNDIENELKHYREHFKNKIIYCNCDDPTWSNFYKYFQKNFDFLKLKKVISTHFDKNKTTYKLEYNGNKTKKTALKGNGDFRSDESINLLKEADIIVTNPPFSLFREYVAQLSIYDKKFLIIGNITAISYVAIFKLIKENKIWLGYTQPKEFICKYKIEKEIMYPIEKKKFGNIMWFTNLDHSKKHEEIILYRNYDSNEYLKYDNYNAINVDKTKDIPADYYDPMGVPITFLDKYNPEQFEILGQMVTTTINENNFGYPYLNGKKLYARLIIKRKK